MQRSAFQTDLRSQGTMIIMPVFHNFIVFLTLLASVRLDDIDPTPPPVKARASASSGELRLFSGEAVQLVCRVPEDPSPAWTYKWFFKDYVTPVSSTEFYSIFKAQVLQNGTYKCQGEKTIISWPYIVSSLPSDPVDVYVDGGWVLLRTPFEPLIIEESTTLTCRIRDNLSVSNVIFYRNKEVISIQESKDLVLNNLTMEDNGMYSCKATWYKNREYQSAQSLPSSLTVLDKVETPKMQILTPVSKRRIGMDVVFRCVTKVNAREQGLSPEYYYLKNGNRLGRASSHDTYSISRVHKEDVGKYSCKVRVRALNVEKFSDEVQLKVLPPR